MEQGNTQTLLIAALVALVIGAGGGYFYGHSKGQSDLLASQKAEEEAAKQEAQAKIAEQVNPFGAAQANPLEGGYENPFEGASINPFK